MTIASYNDEDDDNDDDDDDDNGSLMKTLMIHGTRKIAIPHEH